MNFQCRKCGEDTFVVMRPAFVVRIGWHVDSQFPFIHHGVHVIPSGFLVQCTRHGCGHGWVATARGLSEPGIGAPRAVPARVERNDEETVERPNHGILDRPDV